MEWWLSVARDGGNEKLFYLVGIEFQFGMMNNSEMDGCFGFTAM